MCVTYLGYLLLLWFPGVLHAQSAAQLCVAPRLPHGYIVPEQDQYATETKLTYACEKGYKPAVEGWWATSTCQSGTWSPEPECIVEQACIPPKIPNAKNTESLTGWYKDGQKIWITCDKAYKLKDNDATTVCTNGSWSSVPVCERSVDACGAPPKVPHAVIMDHGHQELFAADTELRYECEDGYTAEGAGNDKTIVCIKGAWTKGPTCSRGTTPSTGHGGGSSGSSLQPAGGGSATAPGAGQGGSTEGATGGSETQPAGRGTTPSTGHGGGSSGSSLQPAGGGSSTTSDSNGGDSRPAFIPIDHCGRKPTVQYAVVEVERNSLRYRCDDYHTLDGLDTVVCQSNRWWSKLPVCKEKPCVLNPDRNSNLKLSGFQHLRDGVWVLFECRWSGYNAYVQCINGQIRPYQCCNDYGYCF